MRCDEPYPSRATAAPLNAAGKARDEEQPPLEATNFALDDLSDDPVESDPLHIVPGDTGANNSRDPG